MGNYQDPKNNEAYISSSLQDFRNPNRKVRIATKVIDSTNSYAFATIKDEIVLRYKEGAKSYIKAKFFEDDRDIFVLNIQGYSAATDKPHNASFSFIGNEIDILLEFIKNIQSVNFKNSCSKIIRDEEPESKYLTEDQALHIFQKNKDLFVEMLRTEITTEDIVTVGYRKKQLELFKKLLTEPDLFENIKKKKNYTDESLWQHFFEKNPWIFGYGLAYVFLSGFNDKKLEQMVQGYSVNNFGKRVDALMKTKGIISNLCFVEIKTHSTALLDTNQYRSGCWAPSKELSGAVAQIQGTVASAVDNLTNKITIKDKQGNPTGEEIFNYQPKSYLVIGNLKEFSTDNGINSDKLRSFELFRRNTHNPEILTFDELFERSKFIVHHAEK